MGGLPTRHLLPWARFGYIPEPAHRKAGFLDRQPFFPYSASTMFSRLFVLMLVLGGLAATLTGCEYAFSDVATRIRYRLHDAMIELRLSRQDEMTVVLRPDHWPDACPKMAGYRLVISPYHGGKQVPTGEILIKCKAGRSYYTGLGSENLYVTRDMTVDKHPDEDLRMTLRTTSSGVEIIAVE